MSAKQATNAGAVVNVAHGFDNAEPRSCVFGELRVRGLEQDLYAVERANDCLGLKCCLVGKGQRADWTERDGEHTVQAARPPATPDFHMYS